MERLVEAPAQVEDTEVKTPIGFLDLPFELRLMIYRLSLPTKKIFDMMEKPMFYGCSYWHNFFTTLASEDGDSYEQVEDDDDDEESNIDDAEADDEEGADARSESDSDEGEESAKDEEDKDDSFSTDDWAEETRPDLDRLTTIRGLLLASRQIRDEALDVLYGENLLCVNVSKASRYLEPLKRLIDEGKNDRVRHIMLVLTHEEPSYGADDLEESLSYVCFAMDAEIWDPLLSTLKTLRVVVDQPCLALRVDHREPCLESWWIERWHDSIERLTSYVSKTIPAESLILTDTRGWMTDRCRKAILHLTDGHDNHRAVVTKMGNHLDTQRREVYPSYSQWNFTGLYSCDWCAVDYALYRD